MATISNYKSDTLITGTSAADSIDNLGTNVTIDGGAGSDTIKNGEYYSSVAGAKKGSISCGDGNDSIFNHGDSVTIDGGNGNDYILNYYGNEVTIDTGAGNDSVFNWEGRFVTIDTGAGNDSVRHSDGNLGIIYTGAGNDSVDTYASHDATIDTGAGNDSVRNEQDSHASINTGTGNDSVYNFRGIYATINTGAGNDLVSNSNSRCVSIDTGAGNDLVSNSNYNPNATINTGDGDDTVFHGDFSDGTLINTGDGNDFVYISNRDWGGYDTINTGADNDIIRLGSYTTTNLIQYATGDGNDTVWGFDGKDTIQIGNGTGTYSTTKSGSDVIVKVGDGSITFKDSANLSLNIDGIEAVEETLSSAEVELRNSAAKALEDFIAIGAGTAKLGTSDLATFDAADDENPAEQIKNSELDVMRLFGGVFELMTKYKLNADGTFQVDQSGNLIEDDSLSRGTILAGYNALFIGESILTSARKIATGKLSKEECTAEVTNIVNQVGEIAKNIADLKGTPLATFITSISVSTLGVVTNVINAFTGGMNKNLAQDMGNNLSTIFTQLLKKLGKDVPIQNVLPSEFTTWITGKTAGTQIESFVNNALKKKTTSYAIGVVTTAVGVYSAIDTLFNSISRYEVDGLPTASKVINTTIDVVGDVIHTASNAAVLALTGGLLNADMIYKGAHIVGAAIKWSLQSGWARITGGDPSQVKFQMTDDRNFTEVIGDALKCWITGTTSAKDVVNEKKKKVYTTNGDNNITNYVSECVINSGTGNDYIFNVDGVYGTNIDAGNDDDNVFVRYRDNAVFGGQGNDEIMLSSDGKNPAYGNDIDGGPGDDQIVINETSTSSTSKKANTVAGGEGNDRIIIPQSKTPVVIRYNVDDGEDYIGGYDSKDTIQIVNSNYTTTKSGDSVIINVGNGAMTLLGAAGKKLNIETLPADDGLPKGLSYNGDKTKITAYTTFRREQINLANYAPTVKQVNASSLVNEVNITGNALDNSIRGGKNSDTIKGDTGDDTLKGENGNDTIYGGAGDDKIDGGKGTDWIFGNAGNDSLKGGAGVDLFVYTLGDGNDTIVDYSNSDMIHFVNTDISQTQIIGSNVVFTAEDGGKLTVKNGKGKTFNITDTRGQDTSSVIKSSSSSDPTLLLLDNSHASSITLDFGVVTADASLRTKKTQITGNMFDNVLIGGRSKDILNGGAGDDVLTGGKGNDVFIYTSGDDIITDYASGDKISASSAMKSFGTNGDDVIINYADGSLTIQDAAGEKITFVENGKTYVNVYSTKGILNGAGTAITLDASTTKFTADSKIVSIDTSAVDGQLEIFGNSKANKIFAGDNDTTLNGGRGNDTLWGGNAADTFIYDDGGGRDVILGFGNNDMLQLGDFTASVKRGQIFFNVGSQKNAVTLKDFSATTFNINGDTYRIQDNKLVK